MYRRLHSLSYIVCVAPDEGATGSSCGWTEGITLPLLQRMETEGKKAEDEGKNLHCCPCERLRTGEPALEAMDVCREAHPGQGHDCTIVLKSTTRPCVKHRITRKNVIIKTLQSFIHFNTEQHIGLQIQ